MPASSSVRRKPRVFNFGSVNIDRVYRVPRFVAPGETLGTSSFEIHTGGKGLNQSVALARAGAATTHVGCIGPDGQALVDFLKSSGVDVTQVRQLDTATGHAVIQVTPDGENAILIHGGANRQLTLDHISASLESASEGDWVLLQNETNAVAEILREANTRQLRVALNAAPMTADIVALPLGDLEVLILNQSEAAALAEASTPEACFDALEKRFPQTLHVITLGAAGAIISQNGARTRFETIAVDPVDTTGAGDTFAGYLVAGLAANRPLGECVRRAMRAAAICVSRPGAACSIPRANELG